MSEAPKPTSGAAQQQSKRAPRKLPTPGGQKKTAVRTTTSTRVVAAGTAALEAKVAELTLTLEISQKGTDTILERAVAAEAEVKDLLASIEKGSAGSKTTESPAKMPESSAILQLKVEQSVALKAVEERWRKRVEEKDALLLEIKRLQQAEIATLQATIASHKNQTQSKTASLQGQMAALQGELQSVKSFTAEQNKFVSNLGEENQKLVGEIKRLKEQAKVRDQQLQESVYLARDAIVREKKKREEWLAKMKVGGQVDGST